MPESRHAGFAGGLVEIPTLGARKMSLSGLAVHLLIALCMVIAWCSPFTLVGRLFDRFYTVESARQSTGLGLSISKLLTEQMGGQISARLDGARLSITLRFQS